MIGRPLRPQTLAALRAALPAGGGSCTLPFAEEVVREVAHPLGAPAGAGDAEAAVARRVVELLAAAFGSSDARAGAALRLAADAPALAAFFQNLDLLVECPRGHAHAVAALVADALDAPAGRADSAD